MAKQWYVFYIKHSRNIKRLESLLHGKDCEIWVPTYRCKDELTGKENKYSLYPGYALVHIDYDSRIGLKLEELSLGYVLDEHVVEICGKRIRGKPRPVPEDQIDIIKEMERSYIVQDTFSLVEGEAVRVEHGPFIGFEGKIVAIKNEGIRVELYIFNRMVQVEINARELTKIQRSDG